MPPVIEIPRDRNPFPMTGVSRDRDGIPRYDELPATLLDMLAEQVDARPDAEALVELGAGRLTYRQLWDRAARVAGGLRAGGLKRGRPRRGALPRRDRLGAGVLGHRDGRWRCGGGQYAIGATRGRVRPVRLRCAGGSGARTPRCPTGEPYVTEQLGRTDTAALFYTSGTTGHPKGVPTTHEAFLTNTENVIRCLRQPRDLGEALRTLISVPLFHVTGCNSQLLAAARLGGASVIMPALNLDELIATLTAERISFMVTVPAVYSLLLRHTDFAAPTCPACGGWATAAHRSPRRWCGR